MMKTLPLALLALALSASALSAQTVRGAFVDPSGQPVAGARAVLRSADGREVASAATGADGGFVIRAPAAGTFVLRIERIGYAATETAAFALAAGETVQRRLSANPQRIALEGIVVQSRSRCTPRPGSGPETATVWGEARKVLAGARESSESGEYRYQVRRYRRQMDARAETILNDSVALGELATGSPFIATPLDQLSRTGYVENTVGGFVFHAPDARVLLSSEFQERHCFALEPGDSGLIGLSFEPVSNARPDVRGTLWLDRATAELRRLEYRYTQVPGLRREGDAAGGRMEFTRLPGGRWIVGRWSIRMPVVTATRVQGSLSLDPSLRDQNALHFRLTGILEEGGEVLSAARADGADVRLAGSGTVTGTVFDSTAARPLTGARVSAAGHDAVTDSAGRFAIPGLSAGDYQLAFASPRLDSLGFTPAPVRVSVREGAVTELALAIPPLAVVWTAGCAPTPSTGALAGTIRGAAGEPSPGASVTVSWSGTAPGSRAAVADPAGVYRLCNLPAGVPLTLRVAARDAVHVSEVQASAGHPRREDIALPAPRAAAAPSSGTAGAAGASGISGTVRDAAGRPVAGATVRIDALPPATTDAQGRFRVRAPGAGEHRVTITHPSLGTRSVALPLPADAAEVELRAGAGQALAASVQRVVQLAGIAARGETRRAGLETLGFYDRQRRGTGTFLTDSALQRVPGGSMANVLRTVRGVRVMLSTAGSGGSVSMRSLSPRTLATSARGSTGIERSGPCLMNVYLDGALVAGPSLGEANSVSLDELLLRNVEAVEVYRGSEAPPEYRNSTSACGVILIWTRR
ncbi:MAG TPA: carboxypeptidase regulatory-like domain-containing protein [Longimicrobium sp.]|nr:carboxypeptidase regulatory-like domain-containing protein [Longimicrobium sp.]